MTNTNIRNNDIVELTTEELSTITGGAGTIDFGTIRAKAQQYCPTTAAKYAGIAPSSVTRSRAQRMGNECLAEMGPFKSAFARGPMQDAIDKAFPR